MRLTPTTDILVFPRLLTLAPGEPRIVRVGTAAPPGPVERTYRLFVEELPALATEAMPPGQVRVLARLGILIFVQPTVGRPALRLGRLALQVGRVVFELRDPGTTHVGPQAVHVRGVGASGGPVWARRSTAGMSWPVSPTLQRGARPGRVRQDSDRRGRGAGGRAGPHRAARGPHDLPGVRDVPGRACVPVSRSAQSSFWRWGR